MSKWKKFRLKDFAIAKNGKPYLYAHFNTRGVKGVAPATHPVFFVSKVLDDDFVIVPKDEIERLESNTDWVVKFPAAVESIKTGEIDIMPKSVVEEIEGLPIEADKFSLLSEAIQVENESVIYYQNLINIFPEWEPVIKDILDEELKHIGQLEALRNEQPSIGQKVDEGENEATAQMNGIAVEGVNKMKGQMNYKGLSAKESYYIDKKVLSAFEDFEDEHLGKSSKEDDIPKVFYHFDNRDFKKGDTISSPHYAFGRDTIDAYKDVVPGGDVSNIIYLYWDGREDLDDMFEVFKNGYEVKPLGPIEKRYMDYSPVVYELNKDIIFKGTPEPELFARAYMGDGAARQELKDKYNYFSDNAEYICQTAEVVNKMTRPEDKENYYDDEGRPHKATEDTLADQLLDDLDGVPSGTSVSRSASRPKVASKDNSTPLRDAVLKDLDGDDSAIEDTVKQGNNWVNKGKEGTHGKFKTKKAADAQRKAMFANGYKANEDFEDYEEGSYYYNGDYDERSKYLLFDIEEKGEEAIKEFGKLLLEIGEIEDATPEDLLTPENFEEGCRVARVADANWIICKDGEIYVEDLEVPDFTALIDDNPSLKDFFFKIGLVEYDNDTLDDDDDWEKEDEFFIKDESESEDPEAKEACACEEAHSEVAAKLAMGISEAFDDAELDDYEYAIEGALADGEISEDDYNYLLGEIEAKR